MQSRNALVVAAALAGVLIVFGATRSRANERAQEPAQANRVIRVSGTAIIYAKPDYATIQLGVAKLSPHVMDAKRACDLSMAQVQAAVRKSGVSQDDIQTVNFQIFPVQPEGKPYAPRQWKVAHYISVKVTKVANVAPILDAAVAAGATDVSQVDYSIEKVVDLRAKAREQAVKVAHDKAEELAKLNGVQLGQPMTISDNSYEGYGAQTTSNVSFDYGNASTPPAMNVLTGGQIAVNAREDIEYAIQ